MGLQKDLNTIFEHQGAVGFVAYIPGYVSENIERAAGDCRYEVWYENRVPPTPEELQRGDDTLGNLSTGFNPAGRSFPVQRKKGGS